MPRSRSLFLLLGLAGVLACTRSLPGAEASAEDGIDLTRAKSGAGYDVVKDVLFTSCLEPVSPTGQVVLDTPANGMRAWTQLQVVKRRRDIHEVLSVGAVARLHHAAGDGRVDAAQSFIDATNETNATAMIASVVRSTTVSLDGNPRLQPSFEALARSDPSRFREVCGTHYVSGLTLGGSFVALAEVGATTADERTEARAMLVGSLARAEKSAAEARATDETWRAGGFRDLRIRIHRSGGAGEDNCTTFACLYEKLATFTASVAAAPRVVDAMVEPYAHAAVEGAALSLADTRADELAQDTLAAAITNTEDALATIGAAEAAPQLYAPVTPEALTAMRRAAEANREALRLAARTCLAGGACALPTGLAAPAVPEERAGATAAPSPIQRGNGNVDESWRGPGARLVRTPLSRSPCQWLPSLCGPDGLLRRP